LMKVFGKRQGAKYTRNHEREPLILMDDMNKVRTIFLVVFFIKQKFTQKLVISQDKLLNSVSFSLKCSDSASNLIALLMYQKLCTKSI